MPGMETDARQGGLNCVAKRGRDGAVPQVVDAAPRGDGKTRRHRHAEVRHLG
jgi:hypothetical protein